MLRKLLISFIQYQLSFLVAPKRSYDAWKTQVTGLHHATIKNPLLAKEIEQSAQKQNGTVPFSDYLLLDQFGENGYHANYKTFGDTIPERIWTSPLSILLKKEGITDVIEFGPGKGSLAVNVLKELKKTQKQLPLWHCIEINRAFHTVITKQFHKHHIEKALGMQVTKSTQLEKIISSKKKFLCIFSFSLDSIPPKLFLNSSGTSTPVNAEIGVSVKNGMVQEEILSNTSAFTQNTYQYTKGIAFELSSWTLHPQQRAYIPLPAFAEVVALSRMLPVSSSMLIMDEFAENAPSYTVEPLCPPKDLHRVPREFKDIRKLYRESGKNLFYYVTYLSSYIQLLKDTGFENMWYGGEGQLAEFLRSRKKFPAPFGFCYAILARKTHMSSKKLFHLKGPWDTIAHEQLTHSSAPVA